MADALGIATSGLTSLQRAIQTTGNNIVNVSTEGYSRQSVEFSTQPSSRTGAGFVGNGVKASGIRRNYDEYLVAQVRNYKSSTSSLQTTADMSARFDTLLADPSTGLTANIQRFFNSLENLTNNPASTPERAVVLAEAKALEDQVGFVDNSLREFGREINVRIRNNVSEINTIAANIASINSQVAGLGTGVGDVPNELYDERDRLLQQLATKVGVNISEQDDGSINVVIGSGQPLVVGGTAGQLNVVANAYDASSLEVGFDNGSGVVVNINGQIQGGELKGLINFREEVLEPSLNKLGLVLVGLTESFNAQHRLGLDAGNQPGADFFTAQDVPVAVSANNSGTASVEATISDVSQLTASDYLVRYDGADWQVLRMSDRQSVIGTLPTTIDGLDISVTGTATAGDSFMVQPTYRAATYFGVDAVSGNAIAAAGPVRGASTLTNTGDASIASVDISSTTGLPLATPVTFTFNPDALGAGVPGYDVTGAAIGPIAYDPINDATGVTVSIPALGNMEVFLEGSPQAGDVLRVENNTAGIGDNTNLLKLSGMRNELVLEGGQSTYQDVYGNLVAEIAVGARQSELNRNTEMTLLQQAEASQQAVSGVNLDEEAANLIRFQQAYQAAAQLINAADTIFQTLLQAAAR